MRRLTIIAPGWPSVPRRSAGPLRKWCVRIAPVAVAAAAAIALAGPTGAASPPTHVVVDSLGRHVLVPVHPQRIISLNSDLTDVVYALGASSKLVAPGFRVTHHQAWLSNHVPRLAKLPSPQGPAGINVEQVAALRPDLIVSTL